MENQKRTIREWRAFRRLNKKKLAEFIGVSFPTYHKWENGRAGEIRFRQAILLSKAFQCEVDDIIFFEDEPNLKLGDGKQRELRKLTS